MGRLAVVGFLCCLSNVVASYYYWSPPLFGSRNMEGMSTRISDMFSKNRTISDFDSISHFWGDKFYLADYINTVGFLSVLPPLNDIGLSLPLLAELATTPHLSPSFKFDFAADDTYQEHNAFNEATGAKLGGPYYDSSLRWSPPPGSSWKNVRVQYKYIFNTSLTATGTLSFGNSSSRTFFDTRGVMRSTASSPRAHYGREATTSIHLKAFLNVLGQVLDLDSPAVVASLKPVCSFATFKAGTTEDCVQVSDLPFRPLLINRNDSDTRTPVTNQVVRDVRRALSNFEELGKALLRVVTSVMENYLDKDDDTDSKFAFSKMFLPTASVGDAKPCGEDAIDRTGAVAPDWTAAMQPMTGVALAASSMDEDDTMATTSTTGAGAGDECTASVALGRTGSRTVLRAYSASFARRMGQFDEYFSGPLAASQAGAPGPVLRSREWVSGFIGPQEGWTVMGATLALSVVTSAHDNTLKALEDEIRAQLVRALGSSPNNDDFSDYVVHEGSQRYKDEYSFRKLGAMVRAAPAEGSPLGQAGGLPEGALKVEDRYTWSSYGRAIYATQTAVSPPEGGWTVRLGDGVDMQVRANGTLFGVMGLDLRDIVITADANALSGFVLIIGATTSDGKGIEPASMFLVRDEDTLEVALNAIKGPTARTHRGLTPELERFVEAYSSILAERYVTGIIAIPLRSLFERALNLPIGSLTKRLKLRADLQTLFLTHGIPPSTLSFNPTVDTRPADVGLPYAATALSSVRRNVKEMMAAVETLAKDARGDTYDGGEEKEKSARGVEAGAARLRGADAASVWFPRSSPPPPGSYMPGVPPSTPSANWLKSGNLGSSAPWFAPSSVPAYSPQLTPSSPYFDSRPTLDNGQVVVSAAAAASGGWKKPKSRFSKTVTDFEYVAEAATPDSMRRLFPRLASKLNDVNDEVPLSRRPFNTVKPAMIFSHAKRTRRPPSSPLGAKRNTNTFSDAEFNAETTNTAALLDLLTDAGGITVDDAQIFFFSAIDYDLAWSALHTVAGENRDVLDEIRNGMDALVEVVHGVSLKDALATE